MVADEIIYEVMTETRQELISFFPKALFAILVLLMGYLIAQFLGWFVRRLLESTGASKIFKLPYVRFDFTDSIVVLTKLFVYLFTIQVAAETVSQGVIAWIVQQIVLFVPRLIGAAAIIVIADIIGLYFKKEVIGTGGSYRSMIGSVVYFFVLYVGIATALPVVIGTSPELVNHLLVILVGALGLGFGLALGLGLKDLVAEISREMYEEYKADVKERISRKGTAGSSGTRKKKSK